MKRPDKILCQRDVPQLGLFGHHTEAGVACSHFLHVLCVGLTYDFSEKKEYFCLAVCKGVAFYVVAVIVEIYGEPTAINYLQEIVLKGR